MAGNGLEWTRTYSVLKDAPQEIKGTGADVPPQARVLLRGWDFHDPEPLQWSDLNMPENIPIHHSDRDPRHKTLLSRIGFRVAIELQGD